MWQRDREYFRELKENECNNSVFMAVNTVAKRARQKMVDTNGMILESKAISWVLTGESPKIPTRTSIEITDHVEYLTSEEYLHELLCTVEDESVVESVRATFEASQRANHLIYCYNHSLDEPQRSRVRILSKIVWDYHINECRGGLET